MLYAFNASGHILVLGTSLRIGLHSSLSFFFQMRDQTGFLSLCISFTAYHGVSEIVEP
jgi:hypothetical protein